MSINKLGKGFIILAAASFLFACASKEDATEVVEPVVKEEVEVVKPPVKNAEELAIEANNAIRAEGRTVYFDLDDDTVKSGGRALLEAHAWYLSRNSNLVVSIEGHCDERGTPAYNLALGERRAKAVAQILMLNGVSASQIQTVSKGEEVPAVDGHDESAWSQNRRGILSYEG